MSTKLVKATFLLYPTADVILPPLTSKVPKYVLEGLPKVGDLLKSRKKYKEISISPLKVNDRYLFSTEGNSPLRLGKGERATFSFSLAIKDLDPELFLQIPNKASTPYGEFNLRLEEIKITEQSELRFPLQRGLFLKFETPTLLSNKLMLPPSFKHKKKIRNMYRLLPTPSLIFASLTKLWNSIAEPKDLIVVGDQDWTAYIVGRMADVTFAEVGYSIKPVTAIVGKDNRGNLRKARGFVGWVKYDFFLNKRYRDVMERLLGLAEFMGVGRSRGIGFGVVKVDSGDKEKG
nr:CRISPR-associated endoribonuclease Cas6 [Candidatus Aramenus sulfurataquae]